MNEAACYVFRSRRDRTVKRRRMNDESAGIDRARRQQLFEHEWRTQDARLSEAIDSTHKVTLDEVSAFISTAKDIRREGKVPTGLITTGLSASRSFFERVVSRSLNGGRNVCVSLTPGDAPNLKTLVKTLISRITQDGADDSDDDGDRPAARSKGPQLLKYDLQILQEWLALRDSEHVVIALSDSEAFDVNVLTDFVLLLKTWLSRIPSVLLIGIATSVDMFQDRLPSAAIKCMQGCAFAVTETNDVLEQACKCCTAASGAKLHLGPDLARMLIQRSHDHVQSVEAFRQSVKYAFISHYYGNPLSIFGMDTKMEDLQERDFEAMRNLHSFRQYLEQLLDRKQAGKARRLLDSNEALAEDLWDATITANTDLEWLCGALTVIQQIQQHTLEKVLGRSTSPYSSLYIKALSGSLNCSSPSVRELLLSIKKLDSEAAESIISHIADTLISMPPSSHDISPDSYFDLQDELSDLVQQHGSLKPPSFLNPGTNPASATIASSKPSTSKSRTPTKPPAPATTIPPHLKAYTSLLTRLHDLLKSYFTCTLPTVPFNHPDFFAPSAPSSTPTPHAPTASSFPESRAQPQWNPHEILFLSTPHRSLLKPALIPSPRHAIERALSRPHDYLGCSCCAAESSSINRSPNTNTDQRHGHDSSEKNDHQPATAILYQLYLESGTLINVADLWTAFRARLTPGIGAARLINGMRDPETERGGYGDAHGSIENEREDVGAVGGDSTQPTSIQTHPQQPEEENTEEGSEEEKERMTRALFVRGLAELKYLGMIRSTRRRNDCVLKVLWRGL